MYQTIIILFVNPVTEFVVQVGTYVIHVGRENPKVAASGTRARGRMRVNSFTRPKSTARRAADGRTRLDIAQCYLCDCVCKNSLCSKLFTARRGKKRNLIREFCLRRNGCQIGIFICFFRFRRNQQLTHERHKTLFCI